LAYQPPANSTFLSEQTSHQQSASSTFLSEQISTSHQPPAKRQGDSSMNIYRKVKTTYITEGIGSILEKEEGAILNS
jgi:hypothetical protein